MANGSHLFSPQQGLPLADLSHLIPPPPTLAAADDQLTEAGKGKETVHKTHPPCLKAKQPLIQFESQRSLRDQNGARFPLKSRLCLPFSSVLSCFPRALDRFHMRELPHQTTSTKISTLGSTSREPEITEHILLTFFFFFLQNTYSLYFIKHQLSISLLCLKHYKILFQKYLSYMKMIISCAGNSGSVELKTYQLVIKGESKNITQINMAP